MAHLIIFGSIWFWVLVTVTISIIWNSLERALNSSDDNGGGVLATIVLIGFGVLYYFFGSKEHVESIFQFVIHNSGLIIGCILGYLVFGVIWSIVKWFFFLHEKRDVYMKNVERYPSQYKKADIANHIPTAADNKFRILTWMYLWVFSATWTLIDQPIKRTFRFVYNKLESTYDKMALKIFDNVHDEDSK